MNEVLEPRRRLRFAAVGFGVGAIIPCVGIWPDFFARLRVAWSGGGGESSDWGEPLFYMAIQGIPAGLLGAAIGFAVAFAVRRSGNSKS
jgi:hypothetical protein